MGNTNPTVSEINLWWYNMGKLGMITAKQKTRGRKPKETLTTSPEINVEKKGTMQGKTSDLHRQNLKRMKKYLEKRSRRNLGASTLMEYIKQLWLMLKMNHEVSWLESLPRNGMNSHLMDSYVVRPHHNNYCRRTLSLMKSKKHSHTTHKNPT